VGLDENSQKPEQIKQSIIDGDTNVGRDVNIGSINQTTTIINNPPGSNTPRIRQFQAPPTPEYYVDRPEVSQDLKRRLLADGGTLVISAIHGLGSVGKSTLAAALAHDADIQKHLDGGVLWATLGQEPDVLSLLGGWVQGLGDYNYRATSIEATSAHLNTLLFDKAVLLVVDDAWIDEKKGWEPVKAFRVGGDRCRMLVTTRDASIANFLGASTFSLDVMTETQALELLIKKAEKQGKRLQEGEIESAQALAKAVGYLPLALELAAAQVASGTSWQVLIADIQKEIARLKSFQDPGIRQISDDEKFKKLSLQASLNLSVKRLSESDRECFAWLGVLPEDASITPKMTATLWNMDERDAGETLQYLRSQALLLPGVFLVDGTATYRLHDLFHDLARNLLTAPQKPKRQGDLVGLGMKWEAVHSQLLDKYWQQTENNLWHTLPDDGYIHQHLVWHLEKAGKVEEIHQLLREDSASGNNGWYEVREKLGQTAGFLTDVTRAWELAEADWEKKNLSQMVGLQWRYALIIASLNSIAAKIPTELIVTFVKNKFWYPEQGLAYALQKQDVKDKANCLIVLADYLPEILKQEGLQAALELARQIDDEQTRTQMLLVLAEKLGDKNLYEEVLELARQIDDERTPSQILLALAEKLDDKNLYEEVLELARQIDDKRTPSQILLALAKKLDDKNLYEEVLELARQIDDELTRTQILLALAKKLDDKNLYEEVLELACQIDDELTQTQILLALAEKLDDKNLYKEVLELARQIDDERTQTQILLALAEKLDDKNLYEEVLELARQINDERTRTQILLALVEKLDNKNLYKEVLELARQINDEINCVAVLIVLAKILQEEQLYNRALDVACAIKDEKHRTEILSALVPQLPESLYSKALDVACAIKDEKHRTEILSALVPQLPESLYSKALDFAWGIQSKYYHLQALIICAHSSQEDSLYRYILDTSQSIKPESSRYEIISALIKTLPNNFNSYILEFLKEAQFEEYQVKIITNLNLHLQDKNFYHEIIQFSISIKSDRYKVDVLIFLFNKVPEKTYQIYQELLGIANSIRDEQFRTEYLENLAYSLPFDLYAKALQILQQIKDKRFRVKVIIALAQNKKIYNDNLYHEALMIIMEIQDEFYLPSIFTKLSKKFPSTLFCQLLKVAISIRTNEFRFQTICTMARNLPAESFCKLLESAKETKSEIYLSFIIMNSVYNTEFRKFYQEVFKALQEVKNDFLYVECLSKIVSYFPEEACQLEFDAISLVNSYKIEYIATYVKLSFLPAFYMQKHFMFSIHKDIMYSSISQRKKLLEWMSASVNIIYRLGGQKALTEVATSVQNVGKWWT
jgi:NB-ARC domain